MAAEAGLEWRDLHSSPGLQTSHGAGGRGGGMQGWEGQGEQPPWASSSPAASTASHDLGRLMGRGSPHPVFLLTGQGVIPGIQYRRPHALHGPLANTAGSSAAHQGRSGRRLRFLKHSPLGKQGILGNPCNAHRDQEADVLFVSGGPLAVTGSSVPSPKQNPFPPQRSNFICTSGCLLAFLY